MRVKVLFDSCVIIAASVFLSGHEDIGIALKHKFYDQSISLISFIRKHLAKRIGIVTNTIESEALGVLYSVIRGELKRAYPDRLELFRNLSAAFNICENRMRNILACLQREPIDPITASQFYFLVSKMYNDLKRKAEALPKRAALLAEAVPRRFKRVADWFDIYKTQDEIEHSQLYNLLFKEVESEDKRILAEAAYLLNSIYKQIDKDTILFIASTDHHFSPVRRPKWTIEGREVTDEIKSRFGIICDWPAHVEDELYKMLK